MAARKLSAGGKKVIVLEAHNRLGGRIYTDKFSGKPLQLGAEFIHGNLPETFSLLKEAGLAYETVAGDSFHHKNGVLSRQESFIPNWDLLMEKLSEVKTDCTLMEFLDSEFKEDYYSELRESVIQFAEGYDAADVNRLSVLSLKEEWEGEQQEQYRLKNGYGELIGFLVQKCEENKVTIKINAKVSSIKWVEGSAIVTTENLASYTAGQVIIAVSLGVLQSRTLNFSPPLPNEMVGSIKRLGFGNVIKFVLVFEHSFWVENVEQAGFIFSEQQVPTWWTALPDKSPVLTGWLAGPSADEFNDTSDEELLTISLQSLATIFSKEADWLQSNLVYAKVYNWFKDDFMKGAYSYPTVNSDSAIAFLQKPLKGTLFFAGEAIYTGPWKGTVEAALASGNEVARKALISN